MSDSIPKTVNPWLLFRHQAEVSGTIALSEMPNLQASQLREGGAAQASFDVKRREDGKIMLAGKASAEVTLECQRCLKPLVKSLFVEFSRALIKSEARLDSVSEEDDAMICEEKFNSADLIEEELILALPMIAKHRDCGIAYENKETDEERQNPFNELKNLIN